MLNFISRISSTKPFFRLFDLSPKSPLHKRGDLDYKNYCFMLFKKRTNVVIILIVFFLFSKYICLLVRVFLNLNMTLFFLLSSRPY